MWQWVVVSLCVVGGFEAKRSTEGGRLDLGQRVHAISEDHNDVTIWIHDRKI